MSGSDAEVAANGPLMARDARISQRARGVEGTIATLTMAFAVERVTRIELAWPAWKVATAVLAGGHRVVCVRFQPTLDDCDSPCLMAR